MQFPRFQTPGFFLKEYFRDNPEQLQTYIAWAIKATKLAIVPLGAVLKHLIEIQGLDPKTEPGRRMREAFQQALNSTFQKFHDHDYDTDFDFSWLNKKFEQTRKDIEGLNLDKEDFKKITDVGKLHATQALDVDQQTPSVVIGSTLRADLQSGVPVTIDRSPVQELADLLDVHPVNQIAPEPAEQERGGFNFDIDQAVLAGQLRPTNDLKDALKKLIATAKELEEEYDVDPYKLMARTEELKDLKETVSKYASPSRPLKKTGKIRRTPTGKTNAVKEAPRKSPKTTKKTLNKNVNDTLSKSEKQADVIQDLIRKGLINTKDLDSLVMEGLDFSSVKAWEQKYGGNPDTLKKEEPKFSGKYGKGSFRRTK